MLPIIHSLVLFSEVFPPANTPLLCHHHFHLDDGDDDDDDDDEDDEDDDEDDDDDDDDDTFQPLLYCAVLPRRAARDDKR